MPGSTTSYSTCKASQALFFGTCPPSFWQQEPTSNYITAQNAVGGQALVSMTSLYSSTDTTVLPHTSFILPGAVNIQIQGVYLSLRAMLTSSQTSARATMRHTPGESMIP
jgi:hypothetical protein